MTNETKSGQLTSPLPEARCRVCTKNIHAGEERVAVYYGGAYYTVCCVLCRLRFESSPRQYLTDL